MCFWSWLFGNLEKGRGETKASSRIVWDGPIRHSCLNLHSHPKEMWSNHNKHDQSEIPFMHGLNMWLVSVRWNQQEFRLCMFTYRWIYIYTCIYIPICTVKRPHGQARIRFALDWFPILDIVKSAMQCNVILPLSAKTPTYFIIGPHGSVNPNRSIQNWLEHSILHFIFILPTACPPPYEPDLIKSSNPTHSKWIHNPVTGNDDWWFPLLFGRGMRTKVRLRVDIFQERRASESVPPVSRIIIIVIFTTTMCGTRRVG